MRKIIAFTLSAIVLLCCLSGCGAKRDPKYYGKWEADYMTIDGKKYEDIMLPVGALFRFELTDDGKVTWKSAVDNAIIQNANEDKDMIWKNIEDNRIEIKVTDLSGKTEPQTMELEYIDDALVIDMDSTQVHLVKVDEFSEIDPYLINSVGSAIQNFGIKE
ncbi:hypothetical protein [Ruminococcus sp.]|uniref:hypothetical protein n=1 Tax=Ruminococcus sp. TaxID=41978 RepID=UPI0025F16685|nr:hypothetical protein [Ruminococcus sp.]MCR4639933.1 hypothetical protein [Ruminococcus sp.]